jgi:hypothetical protein
VDDSLLRDPANFLIARTKLLNAFSSIKERCEPLFLVSPLDLHEECRKKKSSSLGEEQNLGRLRAVLCKG